MLVNTPTMIQVGTEVPYTRQPSVCSVSWGHNTTCSSKHHDWYKSVTNSHILVNTSLLLTRCRLVVMTRHHRHADMSHHHKDSSNRPHVSCGYLDWGPLFMPSNTKTTTNKTKRDHHQNKNDARQPITSVISRWRNTSCSTTRLVCYVYWRSLSLYRLHTPTSPVHLLHQRDCHYPVTTSSIKTSFVSTPSPVVNLLRVSHILVSFGLSLLSHTVKCESIVNIS